MELVLRHFPMPQFHIFSGYFPTSFRDECKNVFAFSI